MSKRVLNPNQLQMLMKPSEIRRTLTGSVDGSNTADPSVDWEEKKTTMLKDSVAHNGVRSPVIIEHGNVGYGSYEGGRTMGNGHHRVQAAKEIEDSGKEIYVPVIHTHGDYMGWDSRKHFPSLSMD